MRRRIVWRLPLVVVGFVLVNDTESFGVVQRRRRRIAKTSSFSSGAAACSSLRDTTGDCSTIEVFDQVFEESVCDQLHDLAQEHCERGGLDGSSIFYRNQEGKEQVLTPLEQALDSFLAAVNNPHEVVEYWTRQEYIDLEVHSDLDEDEFENQEDVADVDDTVIPQARYPEVAHVLYLQPTSMACPTVVFPTQCEQGWAQSSDSLPMVTVPVVPGRVLRFQGCAMHGVPQPVERWLVASQPKSLQESATDRPGVDDDDPSQTRSVILFNTWNERGPQGVVPDAATGAVPEGIELDDDEMPDNTPQAQWEEQYGVDCQNLKCRDRIQWKQTSPLDEWTDHDNDTIPDEKNGNSQQGLEIPLMGSKWRRQYPFKSASAWALSSDIVAAALHQEERVSCVRLRHEDRQEEPTR